jgi:glycosyltransferase involved in cell wall biosynthesis
MRILLSAQHRYPASGGRSSGFRPRRYPSGSGYHLHDLLARGLAETGHQVFYLLSEGWSERPPQGVTPVSQPVTDVDLLHTIMVPGMHAEAIELMERCGKPWLTTCHMDRGGARQAGANWIFVSRSLAHAYGRERYVANGIDPRDCCYSAVKQGYFLFLSAMDKFREKGLDTAVELSKSVGFKLVVAGTARHRETIDEVRDYCRAGGAEYVGDVRGKRKARLMGGARGLLFPSRLNEGCPLVLLEALMSGTPVISSDTGGCPEIVTSDIGFICSTDAEYSDAIARIQTIDPARCRQVALEKFHYLRMTAGYVREYELEIAARSRREQILSEGVANA